jgi:hypothetical protein
MLTVGVALAQPPMPPVTLPPSPPALITSPAPANDVPPLLPPPAQSPIPAQPIPAEPIPALPPEVPIISPPPRDRCGLFGGVDIGLMFPHVSNGLIAPVNIQPFNVGDVVTLPGASLDSTVAPKVTLGYRLSGDLGAILFTYRNLSSEGREIVQNFDFAGDGVVFSRLDINTVGLAYSTNEHSLGSLWGMRWEMGAKLSTVYFDSYGQGSVIGQKSSNYFVGAGPSIALDLTRELPQTGLALYSRTEFTELLGTVTQHYSETVGDPNQPDGFGGINQSGSQGVPVLSIEAGVSWLSRPDGRYRLTTGYSFEEYFAVGKVGASRGEVVAQGLFLRAEFNY